MSKECEQCLQPSNNKFFNCAPRMQDGRNFTDYRPRCMVNSLVDSQMNSYQSRQYMIQKANDLMQKNRNASYEKNRCGPCMEPFNQGTMLPEQIIQSCDQNSCSFKVNDINGLGLGRGSFFDKAFLDAKTNEQKMLANLENCCASSTDDEKYYPFDYKLPSATDRMSIPGGGNPFSPSDRK